jgi:hypothetical protein
VICWLDEPGAVDPERAGGKAAALARLVDGDAGVVRIMDE